jgi:threonylcarbamoyladenosine tRNA methylthiotransferase MtaB
VNQADSFQIEEQLMTAGCTPSTAQDADVVVVNTCSVTGTADQGARQIVRKIARENPAAKIVVTGCYATRRPGEVGTLVQDLQIIPNDRKDRLAEEIGLTTRERFGDGDGACGAEIAPGLAGRTAYTLRAQTGCEETCAYCVIPTTRGKGRSKLVRQVMAEIARVADAGFKEIAITGVHLGSYGRDLGDDSSLLTLFRTIDSANPSIRFRISSLEPMDCSDDIIDLVARSTSFAPHFHLPLQHASDRVLVAMRRPYTLEYYRRLVGRIRRLIPHASIGSDIIVGFPGESDDDFDVLTSFLTSSPLTHLHVFPYSDRPGTSAALLPQKVHGATVRARAAIVREIGRSLMDRFRRSQAGTVRSGLTVDDGTVVVTDNYLKATIPTGLARNQFVNVKLLLAGESFTGEIVARHELQ